MTHLFIWTIVALHGTRLGGENTPHMDWRHLAEFTTTQRCHEAAKELALDPKKYRCVAKGESQTRPALRPLT